MKHIIIDLDGVVFEPVEGAVFKEAVKEYGSFKAKVLLKSYHLGIFQEYTLGCVAKLVYRCSLKAPFLPGAREALDVLTRLPEYSVEFCSKINMAGSAEELESHYRATAPCMNKVRKYSFVSPGESKRDVYTAAKSIPGAIVFVVDNKPENLEEAELRRLRTVLISKDDKDRKKAADEYGARCFDSLWQFHEAITKAK